MRVCSWKAQSARIYVTKEQLLFRRAVVEALILFNRNAMVQSTKGGPSADLSVRPALTSVEPRCSP